MHHLLAFTRQLRSAYIEDAATAAEAKDEQELLSTIRDIMRLESIIKQMESWANDCGTSEANVSQ